MSYAWPMAPDDEELLRQWMEGVVPLSDRARVPQAPQPAPAPAKRAAPRIAIDGDEGRAHGVNDRLMARLRSGGFEVEQQIDLHGARAEAARQQVAQRVRAAATAGVRCMLIIHGRGVHSGGAPVLRDLVVATLRGGACARFVLAFCPALPRHGGDGAMYVLLRDH